MSVGVVGGGSVRVRSWGGNAKREMLSNGGWIPARRAPDRSWADTVRALIRTFEHPTCSQSCRSGGVDGLDFIRLGQQYRGI
jgi:hypothetical protein